MSSSKLEVPSQIVNKEICDEIITVIVAATSLTLFHSLHATGKRLFAFCEGFLVLAEFFVTGAFERED